MGQVMAVLTLPHALASIEDFYRRMYWQAPTALTHMAPDHTLTYSGIAWLHSINQLWISQPQALNGELLDRAADFFRPYRADYSIIFTDTHPGYRMQYLLNVLYGAFFMGPEIGRCAVQPDHFSNPTIRHYLAYVQGEVAACATIVLHEGIAGVWNVGTLQPFRRKGIASALLMRALADAAADGYRSSVLIASTMGRPLYEQMGYRLLGYSTFYGMRE
jgi:GNAT superfamily N-acetyltransferase